MRDYIINTRLAEGQIAVFYLGQESILVKANNKYMLFDAYLSDYVDKNCSTDAVKWIRRYPAPIDAEELDFVDYIFCSHEHFDHTDPYTLTKIAKINSRAKYIVPAPFSNSLMSFGVKEEQIINAYADTNIFFDDISIMPIAAAHEEFHIDANGNHECLGFKVSVGDMALFHAGDCCVYDGLAERIGKADIMMLPVNGRSYFKRYVQDIIGNMTVYEAAELSVIAEASLLIPMHFDLYDVNSLSASVVVDGIESVSRLLPYHIFKPGERYIFSK